MSQEEFDDWYNVKNKSLKTITPKYISIMSGQDETPYQRKLRMIEQLSLSCISCSMCDLGTKPAINGKEHRDPHVLSNCNPKEFMIVGQNPGWPEIKKRSMIADQKIFDDTLNEYSLSREDFYICNIVRCFSNESITIDQKKKCEPFLRMELNLIKPFLVITIGENVHSQFCPGVNFEESLLSITKSSRYGVKVFAIDDVSNKVHVKKMCKLVNAAKNKKGL